MRIALALAVFSLLGLDAFAQGARPAAPPKKVSANGIEYIVWMPTTPAPEWGYPAILGLHGSGDKIENYGGNWSQETASRGYVLITPQAPGVWNGVNLDHVAAIVGEVAQSTPIDKTRVHAMGFSNGAYHVYDLALPRHETFASVYAVAGGLNAASKEANRTPVRIAHNVGDPTVPVQRSRDAKARLDQLGYAVEYNEYPGNTHGTPRDDIAKYFDWLEGKAKGFLPGRNATLAWPDKEGARRILDSLGDASEKDGLTLVYLWSKEDVGSKTGEYFEGTLFADADVKAALDRHFRLVRTNVADAPDFAAAHKVASTPAILVFRSGDLAHPKTVTRITKPKAFLQFLASVAKSAGVSLDGDPSRLK